MSNAKTKSKGSGFLAWMDTHGLTIVAVTLVVMVVASIFVISFDSLSELAEYGNISATVAWLWPVAVDGTILAATVVYFVARKQDPDLKAFTMGTLISFAVVSIVGNVAHGLLADAGAEVAWFIRGALIVFINLVPPVGLLLTVHILASLMTTRGQMPKSDEAVDAVAEVATEASQPVPIIATPAPAAIADASQPEPVVTELAELTEAPDHDVVAETSEPDFARSTVQSVVEPTELDGHDEPQQAVTDDPVDSSEPVTEEVVTEREVVIAEADAPVTEVAEVVESAPQLHAVENIPAEPAAQVDWIVDRARAGRDVTKKALLAVFEEAGQPVSDSTAQRRLREARAKAPEVFAAA